MFPAEAESGISRPESWKLRKTVPSGVPVVNVMRACGSAALIRAICALTLTSFGLKCSRATTWTPRFSASRSAAFAEETDERFGDIVAPCTRREDVTARRRVNDRRKTVIDRSGLLDERSHRQTHRRHRRTEDHGDVLRDGGIRQLHGELRARLIVEDDELDRFPSEPALAIDELLE